MAGGGLRFLIGRREEHNDPGLEGDRSAFAIRTACVAGECGGRRWVRGGGSSPWAMECSCLPTGWFSRPSLACLRSLPGGAGVR
jgi:hypothetical protein